jgi:hypothetical protein
MKFFEKIKDFFCCGDKKVHPIQPREDILSSSSADPFETLPPARDRVVNQYGAILCDHVVATRRVPTPYPIENHKLHCGSLFRF